MEWTYNGILISVLSIYFLLQIQGVYTTGSCPGYLAREDRSKTFVHKYTCYLFVNNELYWVEARKSCWNLGGEMLAIENEETMNYIKGVLDSDELGWRKNGVWLGARLKEGRWKWTNGRVVNYTNWSSGEPSQLLGLLSVEDCILMRRKNGWKWADNLCGSLYYHYNYICQFPLSKPEAETPTISPEAQQYEKDNGFTTILIVIIGLCSGLLLFMLLVFLFLHRRFRSLKLKAVADSVHFINNHTSTCTESSYVSQPPEPPRTHPPDVTPSQEIPLYTEVVKPNNHLTTLATYSPFSGVQVRETHLRSSLDAQGACGGSDPELDLNTPLIMQETFSSSTPDLGQYVDMHSVASSCGSLAGLKEDKQHTYSNVEHKAEENHYEVLP